MILVSQTSHLGQAVWLFSSCTVFLEPGTMILVSCTYLSPVFDRCSHRVLCSGAGNDDSRITDLSSRPSLLGILVVYCTAPKRSREQRFSRHEFLISAKPSGCSRRVLCFGAGNDDARVTDLSPRPSLLDVLVVYCVFGA